MNRTTFLLLAALCGIPFILKAQFLGEQSLRLSLRVDGQEVNEIEANLQYGQQTVERCFTPPMLNEGMAEYTSQTPASQGVPLDLLSVKCVNLTGADNLFAVRATINFPDGNVIELISDPVSIMVNDAHRFQFEPITPSTLLVGEYSVEFSLVSPVGFESEVLVRKFTTTERTWGADSGEMIEPPASAAFENITTPASLIRTGPDSAHIQYATFGIENPEQAFDPISPEANIINIFLYDADTDDDGIIQYDSPGGGAFSDWSLVSFAEYEFDPNSPKGLLDIELIPIDGDNILKPNHFYYLLIRHVGIGASENIRYSTSTKVHYSPDSPYRHDYISTGNQNVLENHTIIVRLGLNDLPTFPGTKNVPLDPGKYTVSPNPASQQAHLDLRLAQTNRTVTVDLIDIKGHVVATQIQNDLRTGRISFDVQQLPAGQYYFHIRTEKEGATMAKIVVVRA